MGLESVGYTYCGEISPGPYLIGNICGMQGCRYPWDTPKVYSWDLLSGYLTS